MANTYTLIASNVLSSSAASVTFSAIPSTYTDLVVRFSARANVASYSANLTMTLNGSSSSIYSRTDIRADSSTVTSARTTSASSFSIRSIICGTSETNTFSTAEIYIPNYLVSANKALGTVGATEGNTATAGTVYQNIAAGLFADTTAISSIALSSSADFVSGSSFYLYGIKNS
jgi:hypothetical protein